MLNSPRMQRITQRIFLVCLIGASSCVVQAQTLLSIYESARQSDPTYQAALAEAFADSEAYEQARAALLPQISAAGYIQKINRESNPSGSFNPDGTFDVNGYGATLTQTILRFDQFAQYSIGKLQAQQAELDLVLAEQTLIARTAEAYFTFLAAQSDLVTARAERESIASQLEQANKRYEVGLIAITDVQEAQASYDLADAQLILAEQNMENARDALLEISGTQIGDLADLQNNFPLQPPEGPLKAWVQQALQSNPSLAKAALTYAIADKNIALQEAGHLPSLNAQAEYSYQDNSDIPSISASETTDTTVSLQLNIPIFSGGAVSSRVREATYQKIQAQQLSEQTQRQVEREVRAAYRSMQTAVRRVQALEQARQSNKAALEATQAGYDVGTRTSVDVLNARSGLFRAQRDYAKARYDYALSLVGLHRAAGILSPEELVLLNSWLDISQAEP